jgi:hypothetical protein
MKIMAEIVREEDVIGRLLVKFLDPFRQQAAILLGWPMSPILAPFGAPADAVCRHASLYC